VNAITQAKPGYLVFAPLGLIFAEIFIGIGLMAKWTNGLDPVCYHRSLFLFIVGMVILGISILGTNKLFAKSPEVR
jgi:hypothetical protein